MTTQKHRNILTIIQKLMDPQHAHAHPNRSITDRAVVFCKIVISAPIKYILAFFYLIKMSAEEQKQQKMVRNMFLLAIILCGIYVVVFVINQPVTCPPTCVAANDTVDSAQDTASLPATPADTSFTLGSVVDGVYQGFYTYVPAIQQWIAESMVNTAAAFTQLGARIESYSIVNEPSADIPSEANQALTVTPQIQATQIENTSITINRNDCPSSIYVPALIGEHPPVNMVICVPAGYYTYISSDAATLRIGDNYVQSFTDSGFTAYLIGPVEFVISDVDANSVWMDTRTDTTMYGTTDNKPVNIVYQDDVVCDLASHTQLAGCQVTPTVAALAQSTRIKPTAIVVETPTVPVIQSWQSGTGAMTYAPRAGEICWGQTIGKLVNTRHSYLVQFTADTPDILIRNGACELFGRSFAQIEQDIKRDYTGVSWVVISDYTNASAMPAQVNWNSGPGEHPHSTIAGEICWGTFVGQYRQNNASFIVQFTQDTPNVIIKDGACELYGRTLAQIEQDVKAQYADVTWILIDNYSSN